MWNRIIYRNEKKQCIAIQLLYRLYSNTVVPTGGIVFNLSSLIQQKKFKKWISAYSVDIGIDSVQINHFLSEWFFSFQSIRIAVWWTNLRLKVTRLKPAYGLQGLAGGIVGPWKCRFSLPTGVPEKCSFFPLMLCSFFMTDTSSVFSSFTSDPKSHLTL